ncbi:hypothetical protein IW262DRAFT_1468158 [Armillaria fumosa]|nr:hypothetical protein IW262DRAFT_1468158 [Armillaria fumosa]
MSSFSFLSFDFFNQLPLMFSTTSIPGPITLEATGLLMLADLLTVTLRMVLTGGASFLNALILMPEMYKQQYADEINQREFPMTGAMTSGYVFHMENPTTGSINDLKAMTSGQWLQDLSATENFAIMFATMLVYASAILAFNVSTVGSLLIGGLLLFSVTLLTLCNSSTQCLQMYDYVVQKEGEPQNYKQRWDMAEKLIDESKMEDWAVGMGLVLLKIGSNRPVTV